MEPTDWRRVHVEGMNGYEEVIKRHEAALLKLEAELIELRAGLRPGQRLETVWFRRYAAVMLALLDAGMPEELDVAEVGAWIRAAFGRPNGGDEGSARRCDGGTGNGMGCREEAGVQHVSFRCDGSVRLDPPMPKLEPLEHGGLGDDRCSDCGQGR